MYDIKNLNIWKERDWNNIFLCPKKVLTTDGSIREENIMTDFEFYQTTKNLVDGNFVTNLFFHHLHEALMCRVPEFQETMLLHSAR